jgi:hypothetical protein
MAEVHGSRLKRKHAAPACLFISCPFRVRRGGPPSPANAYVNLQVFTAVRVRSSHASGVTLMANPSGGATHGTNCRSRPKSARTIPRSFHANGLCDDQTQGGARCDAREDRRASRQTSLGLRPDGTIAFLEPPGGCWAKEPRAIASGHARRLSVLNRHWFCGQQNQRRLSREAGSIAKVRHQRPVFGDREASAGVRRRDD